MKWRKLAHVVHRDLGYFFAGVVLIFALSGLAVNHADDWGSSFILERKEVVLDLPRERSAISDELVRASVASLDAAGEYRGHDFPGSTKIKIYLVDGSILARISDGRGIYETIRTRPIIYQLNLLHLSRAKWWRVFSDIFAISLAAIAVTGLLIPQGRRGLAGRGKWLLGAGALIPLAALVML